jgi:alpha-amylase/alpha-mannosidase (GH57 family)
MPQIHLVFVWHMHQPFYKDLVTGEHKLPWTRLHALKDYYGMVKILDDFPTVHQTFNLVPSMLVQIRECAEGKASSPFITVAIKPAQDLSEAEQEFLLRYFFQANVSHMIFRYPRYASLYNVWLASGRDARRAIRLAWFDEEYQDHDPEVRALIAKEQDYALADQALAYRKQLEILGRVIPAYREFSARGQIELSTTPFYHPILPLLCDSNIASISHPGVPLPSRFRYPEDARHQILSARAFMEKEFGQAPAGMWPSEGSVSDETLGIAADAGFQWIATDNGVLARTLQKSAGAELTYRSYRWTRDGQSIDVLFRDHYLSDLIGFSYSKMGAAEAAEHFLHHIRVNSQPALDRGEDVLVPIILDGENAWEHFPRNGRPFLRELYRRITEAPDLRALTVSEALQLHQPQPLSHIFPGSWINANFDVWIGAEEDNKAWELLLRARQRYDDAAPNLPEENRKLAHEELMIAEGSDWCWWYGPEHASDNRVEFDQLYRDHLANVYRALRLAPPEELSRPILQAKAMDVHEPPAARIAPVIDGEVTSYFEWMGAGHYAVDPRSGSMHSQKPATRDLYYGADETNLYLRLDFELGVDFTSVELRTETAAVPLLGNQDVQSAYKRVFESRIPLDTLGLAIGQTLRFRIVIANGALPLDVVPRDGWIDFTAS